MPSTFNARAWRSMGRSRGCRRNRLLLPQRCPVVRNAMLLRSKGLFNATSLEGGCGLEALGGGLALQEGRLRLARPQTTRNHEVLRDSPTATTSVCGAIRSTAVVAPSSATGGIPATGGVLEIIFNAKRLCIEANLKKHRLDVSVHGQQKLGTSAGQSWALSTLGRRIVRDGWSRCRLKSRIAKNTCPRSTPAWDSSRPIKAKCSGP